MKFRQLAALDARRWGKVLCAAWLVALLTAPAIFYVLGKRQPLLENKPHAPFAQHSFRDLTDPKTFTQLDTNALEVNPLREFALDARARVVTALFDESPVPTVVLGEDGWLFDRETLFGCDNTALTDEVLANLDVLSRALRTAGKQTAIVLTGSKLLAEARRSPRVSDSEMRCVETHQNHLDEVLARIPGGVVLDPLMRAQAAAGKDVYRRDDSHWNGIGRVLASRAILKELLPERNQPVIHQGDREAQLGDIARFVGFSRRETFLNASATMPRGHVPLKPREAVFLGDSQMQSALFNGPHAPGYLVERNAQLCRWGGAGTPECQRAIRRARYMVIESVSHHFDRINGCFEPMTAAVADLKGRTATLAGQRNLKVNGQATSIEIGGVPDVSDVDRVIRIKTDSKLPVGLGQQALAGPPALCVSPASVGGHLVLAVPAGNRLSELRLGLTTAGPTGFKADVVDIEGKRVGL